MHDGWRKRAAPLMLAAAGVGGFLAIDGSLPQARTVTIVLGTRAATLRELELSWSDPREPSSDAALTTRWTFQPGAAPRRLHAQVKLPDGEWDAVLSTIDERGIRLTQRSVRVTLGARSWWSRRQVEEPVTLSLDEAPQ